MIITDTMITLVVIAGIVLAAWVTKGKEDK